MRNLDQVVTIILGWYASKPHQLKTFVELHRSLGVRDVFTFSYSDSVLFTVDIDDQRERIRGLLKQIKAQVSGRPMNIVCHAFSNNGFLALEHIEEQIRNDDEAQVNLAPYKCIDEELLVEEYNFQFSRLSVRSSTLVHPFTRFMVMSKNSDYYITRGRRKPHSTLSFTPTCI